MKKLIFILLGLCSCNIEEQNSIKINVISSEDIEIKQKFVIDTLIFVSENLEKYNKSLNFFKTYSFLNKVTVEIHDTFGLVEEDGSRTYYGKANCNSNMIWFGWYTKNVLIHEFLHILECTYDGKPKIPHQSIWWDKYRYSLEKLWLEGENK